jgi:hypothetical protein
VVGMRRLHRTHPALGRGQFHPYHLTQSGAAAPYDDCSVTIRRVAARAVLSAACNTTASYVALASRFVALPLIGSDVKVAGQPADGGESGP